MNYDKMQIGEVVMYINAELLKNRTMADIEKQDFNENKGVITKRLNRKGYKKIGKLFQYSINTADSTTKILQNTTDNKVAISKGLDNTTAKTTNILHSKYIDSKEKTTQILQDNTNNTTEKLQAAKKTFTTKDLDRLDKLLNLDLDTLENIISEYTTKNNTSSSIKLLDHETKVTSVRLNKQLYFKIKEYSEKNNIKLLDIFNEMMLDYLNKYN